MLVYEYTPFNIVTLSTALTHVQTAFKQRVGK